MNSQQIEFTTTEYPKSPQFKDLSGEKFGNLTVDRYAGMKDKNIYYWCTCDCGNKVLVQRSGLVTGRTKSCDCMKIENLKETVSKRSEKAIANDPFRTKLHNIWRGMRDRCNPNLNANPLYVKRGITVCDEWNHGTSGFNKFYDWAISSGYVEGARLDRIDLSKGFNPSNCRWSVDQDLRRVNQSKVKYATYIQDFSDIGKGVLRYTLPLMVWARRLGTSAQYLEMKITSNRRTKTINEILQGNSDIMIIDADMMKYDNPYRYEDSYHD